MRIMEERWEKHNIMQVHHLKSSNRQVPNVQKNGNDIFNDNYNGQVFSPDLIKIAENFLFYIKDVWD